MLASRGGQTEGCVRLGARPPPPAPCGGCPGGADSPPPSPAEAVLPVWPLAPRAPATLCGLVWRIERPLRGGGLNELVCAPSCPAGRCLAQGLGAGCWAALGGPGYGPPPLPLCQLGASELQACRPGWSLAAWLAEGGLGLGLQASHWTQQVVGPGAGGRAPGEALAGWEGGRAWDGCGVAGNRARCTRPGNVLDSRAREGSARPGSQGSLPGPVVNSGKGGRAGSRPSCFVCGEKGGWGGGSCGWWDLAQCLLVEPDRVAGLWAHVLS